MLKSSSRFIAVLLLLALGQLACAHSPDFAVEATPCAVASELPETRWTAASRVAIEEGALRVDLDGDGEVDLTLWRDPAGNVIREELFAEGSGRVPAAAFVREWAGSTSRSVRKSARGRRSVDVSRQTRDDGTVSDLYLIAITDAPLLVSRDGRAGVLRSSGEVGATAETSEMPEREGLDVADEPIVRQELRLGADSGAAFLARGIDRDHDGFFGRTTQHVQSRVRPWKSPGALVLTQGDLECGEKVEARLQAALDLAVSHGARCVREGAGTSPITRSSQARGSESSDEGSTSPDAVDSKESDTLASTGLRGEAAESRLRVLEWLWTRSRTEVTFACVPMPICGAVDQVDVARSWLRGGEATLFIGADAWDGSRCGALSATVGRLLRYYDPASFDFDEASYDAFSSCLDSHARRQPACAVPIGRSEDVEP